MVDAWPGLQVRFVGFGRSGLGDPGWDLAGCLETIAVLVGPTTSDAAACARSHAQEALLAEYFMHAYRRAGGPGRVQPAMQAVHALSSAWRTAQEEPTADPGVRLGVLRRLERARELASRGDVLAMAA
jgi:hypothetical protein